MKKWKQVLMSFALVASLGAALVPAPTASAINVFEQCKKSGSSNVCKSSKSDDAFSLIKTIINVVLGILGAIAVVMIVIGGFRYVVSAGEAKAVSAAKNTILYAVVGLVVAIFAFSIVNFVVGRF